MNDPEYLRFLGGYTYNHYRMDNRIGPLEAFSRKMGGESLLSDNLDEHGRPCWTDGGEWIAV